jgi:histidine triad (HIT) family protein
MAADGCIFCQILANKAPATVLYEDDVAIVILDLFPIRAGHTLIIPRHHAPLLEQQSEAVSAHLFTLARRVIAAHKKAGLELDAHNVVLNDGKAANQHVPHVHVHVIPRKAGDTGKMVMRWWTRMLPFTSMATRRRRLEIVAERLRGLI